MRTQFRTIQCAPSVPALGRQGKQISVSSEFQASHKQNKHRIIRNFQFGPNTHAEHLTTAYNFRSKKSTIPGLHGHCRCTDTHTHLIWNKIFIQWSGLETAQQLSALAILEDKGVIPSIHVVSHNCQSHNQHLALHTHKRYTDIPCTQVKHPYT